MSVLAVAQDVCREVGLAVPSAVMSSTDREYVELARMVNKQAKAIARSHYWELLKTVATITGDGATEAHALPSDYDRMLQTSELWSSSLEAPLTHIADANRWLGLDVQSFDFVVNAWTKYGGQIHIKPALASAVTAQYFYQSNLIFSPNSGSNIAVSTADDDTFRLDDELLTLAMIWQWRENKGLPYAEDLANYERRLAKLIKDDKGARILRIGRQRMPTDIETAYPQTITDS